MPGREQTLPGPLCASAYHIRSRMAPIQKYQKQKQDFFLPPFCYAVLNYIQGCASLDTFLLKHRHRKWKLQTKCNKQTKRTWVNPRRPEAEIGVFLFGLLFNIPENEYATADLTTFLFNKFCFFLPLDIRWFPVLAVSHKAGKQAHKASWPTQWTHTSAKPVGWIPAGDGWVMECVYFET